MVLSKIGKGTYGTSKRHESRNTSQETQVKKHKSKYTSKGMYR